MDVSGRWVDIDPSPGVPYGQTLVRPTAQEDEPDPKLFHVIEIRMELESIHEGKRETRNVLQYSTRAIDLAGVPIGVFHEKKADTSTPVLMVGDRLIRGESFQSPVLIGVGGVQAPVLNPFATGADRLSAEWVKFRLTIPSGERRAEYTIVDTEGPSARQLGTPPSGPTLENVKAVSKSLGAFVGIGIATGRVPVALLASIVGEATDPESEAGLVHLLAMTAFSHHVMRELLPPSFLDTMPLWYIDSPYVVVVRTEPNSSAASAGVSLDLTLKGYRNLRTPDDSLRRRGPFYDHLAGGVLDHTLERWLLGIEQATGTVGTLFETLVEQGIRIRYLPANSRAPDAPLSADGRQRLATVLSSGTLALLPNDRPKGWQGVLGWWAIDPATGWAEDTTEIGGHSAPEYSGPGNEPPRRSWQVWCTLGFRVLGIVAQAASYQNPSFEEPAQLATAGAIACEKAKRAGSPGGPPGPPGLSGPPPPPKPRFPWPK